MGCLTHSLRTCGPREPGRECTEQGLDSNYGPRTVQQYINRDEFELFDIEEDPLESKKSD